MKTILIAVLTLLIQHVLQGQDFIHFGFKTRIDSVLNNENKLLYFVKYDDSGNILKMRRSECVNSISRHVHFSGCCDGMYEFEYDKNGNKIIEVESASCFTRNNSSLVPYSKTEYRYDEENKKILSFTHYWDEEIGEYIPKYKTKIIYNDSSNQTEYYYDWDDIDNVFVPRGNSKILFKNNRLNSVEYYSDWDKKKNEFIPKYRDECTNDENGKRILRIHSVWDEALKRFNLSSKYVDSFDKCGNNVLSKNYDWDLEKESWVLINQEEVEYRDCVFPKNFVEYHRSSEQNILKISGKGESIIEDSNLIFTEFKLNDITNHLEPRRRWIYSITNEDDKRVVYAVGIYKYDLNFEIWKIENQYIEYHSKITQT